MLRASPRSTDIEMNDAHLHLITNHIPVLGLPFALALLLWGLFRRQKEVRSAAFLGFFLVALASFPAFLSGHEAEEVVEHMAGVREGLIEDHEEAAEIAFYVTEALGLFALLCLFLGRGGREIRGGILAAFLLLAVASSGLMARTAFLGGPIHHSEIEGGRD